MVEMVEGELRVLIATYSTSSLNDPQNRAGDRAQSLKRSAALSRGESQQHLPIQWVGVPAELDPHGFGPPGPNLPVDLGPGGFISASGFPPPPSPRGFGPPPNGSQ